MGNYEYCFIKVFRDPVICSLSSVFPTIKKLVAKLFFEVLESAEANLGIESLLSARSGDGWVSDCRQILLLMLSGFKRVN